MCYSPLKILNPAKRLDIYRGSKLFIEVPCGHCCECKKQKTGEYFARCYSEYEYTRLVGGFTFWDTLTYNDEHLPHFHGIECFSRDDITNFFKRLKIHISRYQKYDKSSDSFTYPFKDKIEGNLSYYQCSEFGHTTHRPHYHVLFFCRIPGMNPWLFANFIKKAWSIAHRFGNIIYYERIGFTDRIYTIKKRIVDNEQGGIINYLAKYVNKDDEFLKNFEDNINNFRKFYSDRFFHKAFDKSKLRKVYPFHRQSQGFGKFIINLHTQDELYRGVCKVPDKFLRFRYVRLPKYIERKLFYTLESYPDGSKHWVLNEIGIKRFYDQTNDRIDSLTNKYTQIYENLENICVDNICSSSYYRDRIDSFLDNRTWFDFATYVVCYRGRMCSDTADRIPSFEFLTKNVFNISDNSPYFDNNLVNNPYEFIMRNSYEEDSNGCYHLATHPDGSYRYERYRYYSPHIVNKDKKSDKIKLKTLRSKYLIDENRFIEFRNFDKLYDLIYIILKPLNSAKEERELYLEKQKEKYESI